MDIKQTSVCVAIVSVSEGYVVPGPGAGRIPHARRRSRTNAPLRIIPEVRAQIKTAGSELALGDIAAYLYAQGFSTEIAQGRLLTIQTCNSVWRKQALRNSWPRPARSADPACVEIFSEAVDTTVPNSLEGPPDQLDELKRMVESRRPRWLQDERSAQVVALSIASAEADGGGGADDAAAALEEEKQEEEGAGARAGAGTRVVEQEQEQEQEQARTGSRGTATWRLRPRPRDRDAVGGVAPRRAGVGRRRLPAVDRGATRRRDPQEGRRRRARRLTEGLVFDGELPAVDDDCRRIKNIVVVSECGDRRCRGRVRAVAGRQSVRGPRFGGGRRRREGLGAHP